MPSADFGDYAAIPHFQGCQRQTLGITQQSLTFKDASGSLLGLRSNPSLSRMPSADFWDYVAIPHFPGCRRQTFGITQQSPTFKDAFVLTLGIMQQSPTYKVPAAACWVFEVILPYGNIGVLESLSYQICLSLLKQADSSLYFRNTYTLLPTVTYTFAIPLLYP